MKKIFLAFLFIIVAIYAGPPAHAQETTLQIGTLGNSPGAPPNVRQQLSTAQVDAILNLISPSQFGSHYTRDKANGMFADLDALRARLHASLIPLLSQIDHVKGVKYLAVNTNPIKLRLSQTPSGLRVDITDISFDTTLDLDFSVPLLCSSAEGRVRVDNIAVSGEYNIATGLLQNPNVTYSISNIDASCSGLLSHITNHLYHVFLEGRVRDLVREIIRSEVADQLRMVDMRTVFSARDFLEGLRNLSGNNQLNAIANDVINRAQEIIANPAALNRQMALDIQVLQAPGGNVISFIAFHNSTTDVIQLDYPQSNTGIGIYKGYDTGSVDLFYRPPTSSQWHYMGNTTGDYFNNRGTLPIGTEIGAIGISQHSSNLRSFLGVTKITTFDASCRHSCPPREVDQ